MSNANWLHSLSPITRGAILILLLAGLALLQQTVSFSSANRLEIALNNAAHAPWFFLITCLLWHITALFVGLRWRAHLLWVAGLALTLATGLEAVQFFTRRDADLSDVGLNLLGACSGLLAILAAHLWRQGHIKRAGLSTLLAVVLLSSSLIRAAEIMWVYSKRDAIAPELLTFDRPDFPLRSLLRGNWELITVRNGAGSHHLAKVTLNSQLQWPGLTLREPVPDWNGYRWLVLVAYTESERSLSLEIRLETQSDRGMESTVNIELPHNAGPVRIPLAQLAGSRFGKLDEVRNLYLFSSRLDRDRQFYLESISLE